MLISTVLNPIDGPAIFEVIVEYELPVVPAGWVVELRTPITAGELPIVELWDAAIADRNEALEKVCKRPQAIDVRPS